MILYEFDENGYLMGKITSDMDIELRDNQTKQIPEFKEGKIPKWNGSGWELVDIEEKQEPEIAEPENPLLRIEKQLKALELQSEQTEAVLQEMIISGM